MNGKKKKHELEPSEAQEQVQDVVVAEDATTTPPPEAIDVGAILSAMPQKKPIGKDEVLKATETLKKYKEGKANLERKIIDNEQWYKMRHWECMRDKTDDVQPTSAWLFNCIANKHADAMDNFPSPNVLPREEGDKADAQMLSAIIPVILDQNDFEKVYSDVWNYKLKSGTGVYGVFWDKDKLNGLGDIAIQKVDLINLFWESGITDIQKSRNLFHVELVDNDVLLGAYPHLSGGLGSSNGIDLGKYVYDDNVDTNNKSAVIDWYYKKNVGGRTVLHFVKYVNDEVLFASENEPDFAEKGLYDHGKYPFIFDVLFQVEGTPTGFGYIDVGKDAQSYIDRLNQAIMKNSLTNAQPRYFIREDGGVNEEEYADLTNDFIHVSGNLGQDSILPVSSTGLGSIYVEILNNKIEELKETTGNRDVSTGGTGGATAASAIAAMQESGSKLSRDANKQSYRAFRELTLMIVELIRQFYDLPRCFRIMGNNGAEQFITYSNANIAPQAQGNEFDVDMGYRIPLFDIEISAQKQSPYSKMAQNEMALSFYGAGFFNPQMADQSLACLEMMDFDRKEFVMQRISENGGMFQQMMMMQQQMMGMAAELDRLKGTNMAQMMAQQMGASAPPMANGNGGEVAENVDETEALGGNEGSESSVTKDARKRVAQSTSPT